MSKDFITVLNKLSFVVETSSWTSLMGVSGSGKSTLLTLLAGLDLPSSGSIKINNQDVTQMNEDDRSDFRSQNMGFIFQNFRLLPHLTALENVQIPLELLGAADAEDRASQLLKRVGLANRLNNLPSQMSGGEQQRVAVARAFVARPKILFADEPTGNLDSKNGLAVLELMKELHLENSSTLIVVTHDSFVASYGKKQLKLKDGNLVPEL